MVAAYLELVESFARETETLGALDHYNMVTVLAPAGEEGKHYLVLELVGGGSLRELPR